MPVKTKQQDLFSAKAIESCFNNCKLWKFQDYKFEEEEFLQHMESLASKGCNFYINPFKLPKDKNSEIDFIENIFIVQYGCLVFTAIEWDGLYQLEEEVQNKEYKLKGLILKDKNNKPIFVRNADADLNDINNDTNLSESLKENISMSFKCLEGLVIGTEGLDARDYCHSFLSKIENVRKLKVLDYVEDKFIEIKAQKLTALKKIVKEMSYYEKHTTALEALEKYKENNSPGPGFTLISNIACWHRPSTILIQYEDVHFLLGIDEDQYFGVELAGKPKTIEEAYDDLKPDILKNEEFVDPKQILRQGEWFFAKLLEEPDVYSCYKIRDPKFLTLPKDSIESSDHDIHSDFAIIDQNMNLCIQSPFSVRHKNGQHQDVEVNSREDWYLVVKNTAVNSVSEEGVD